MAFVLTFLKGLIICIVTTLQGMAFVLTFLKGCAEFLAPAIALFSEGKSLEAAKRQQDVSILVMFKHS
jgi:hypothetical protein